MVAILLACKVTAGAKPYCFCSQTGDIKITTTMPADSSQVSSIDTTTAFLCRTTTALTGSSCASALRCCISRKIGVSCNQRRRYIATSPKAPPSRNGIRQPQSSTACWVMLVFTNVATTEPSRIPTVSPAVSVPQAIPIRRAGTCSATNTQAPGTSPPIAAPCKMRINNSNTGAIIPIEA